MIWEECDDGIDNNCDHQIDEGCDGDDDDDDDDSGAPPGDDDDSGEGCSCGSNLTALPGSTVWAFGLALGFLLLGRRSASD
jgi:uncharacterized protein (TIGR03382 family)